MDGLALVFLGIGNHKGEAVIGCIIGVYTAVFPHIGGAIVCHGRGGDIHNAVEVVSKLVRVSDFGRRIA